jgi:hypothetical protein
MDRRLYVSADGVTNIQSIQIDNSFGQTNAVCAIDCDSTTLALNDPITVDMGFTSDHQVAFVGYVKQIDYKTSPGNITITAKDTLIRAVDFFIVADDPENPRSYENILERDLVKDLITAGTAIDPSVFHSLLPPAPSFTFGTNGPMTFNLLSAWDAASQIAQILAYSIYADSGSVYFADIKPYIRAGDVSIWDFVTGEEGNILQVSHEISDKNLRNKVVVYGKNPITAEASGSSPYLPANYYKAAVIANELIDTQTIADNAADYNLSLYNRLTETINCEVLGNPGIKPRQFVTITESLTQTSGSWFIHSVTHNLDDAGFVTRMMLSR